jgi:hypothetical protein
MSKQDKYAEKIVALLRKAESTTPEEAELLVEKAQQLMTEYAISEAMLDANRGIERDEIEQQQFKLQGVFRDAIGELLWAICSSNNCRAVMMKDMRMKDEETGKYKLTLQYTVTGFRSDINRTEMLFSSLQIQAASAQGTWAKTELPGWYSSSDKWRARRDFLSGFSSAVRNRLAAANAAAKEAAAATHAAENSTTVEEASSSVALVLRSRKDRVDEWFDQKYGKSLRSARQTYRRENYGARAAGSAAGSRADIGQGRVGGRKSIQS